MAKLKNFFTRLNRWFSRDLGIDLGTVNTLVCVPGEGIILNEPSIVAVDVETGEIKAVGKEARRMVGRTPSNIQAIRPLRDGVIADFDATEKMIQYFIKQASAHLGWINPRVMIGVPAGITEVERRAVIEAAIGAGARSAETIEESLAAAIGAGLAIAEPSGNMVVDIGGGTTEVSVISLGGIVVNRTIRIGGDELDEAVIQYLRHEHNLLIGERTAEMLKIRIGSLNGKAASLNEEVRGRDLVTGLPRAFKVNGEEIAKPLHEVAQSFISAVRETLEQTPPELASDIMEKGILLTGGGALLDGLADLLESNLGVPVKVAENALDCVAVGTGKCLLSS